MKKNTSKKAIDHAGVSAHEARAAVEILLRYLGEDPAREGLLETPDRFCRALLECTQGYTMDEGEILSTTFHAANEGLVVLKDIAFDSFCEHHLLPFSGKAHVGYLPAGNRVVGLSKLARVVDVFAKRLQVQERLTTQIAEALQTYLKPSGVGVVVEATHSCMCVRGVQKSGAFMVTSTLLGSLRHQSATRAEFMALVGK